MKGASAAGAGKHPGSIREPFLCNLLFIKRNIPITERQKKEYLSRLKQIAFSHNTAIDEIQLQKYVFEHMYDNLTILDGKTAGILQFNGILLAAVGAFFADDFVKGSNANLAVILLYNAAFNALLSVIFCHRVIWVKWSGSAELSSRDSHQERELLSVRNSRTIFYRRAWWFSFVSVLFFLILMLFKCTEQLLGSAANAGAKVEAPIVEGALNFVKSINTSLYNHEVFYLVMFLILFGYDFLISIFIHISGVRHS
jgi:hypothetical protein